MNERLDTQHTDYPTNDSAHNFQQSQTGAYDQLNNHFNQQDSQSKTIQEAREILGESAQALTDEQVYDMVNEVQFLVDSWLEEFEKNTFDGKTLDQVLGVNAK